NNSVIIDGQDIEVFVEAFDDLGAEGSDRVVFYVNDSPVEAAYQSYSAVSGSYAQEHVYRALLAALQGIGGFTIQAVAYDVLGQSGASQVVPVGTIQDTVVPKINVLNPPHQDILTVAEPV